LIDCVFDDPTGSLSLVFEYMDTDLHRYIHDADETLSPGVVRSLLKQCLSGIECCHGCGILHRGTKLVQRPARIGLPIDAYARSVPLVLLRATRGKCPFKTSSPPTSSCLAPDTSRWLTLVLLGPAPPRPNGDLHTRWLPCGTVRQKYC
jgi:hypothetical protein